MAGSHARIRKQSITEAQLEELYLQLAEKDRIEKEVRAAATIQKSFFPASPLDHPHLRLWGHSVAATQCTGDWWQYARINDYVVIAIGDVMGHGVGAALVTASVQSAFCVLMQHMRDDPSTIPSVAYITKHLDQAVKVAGEDFGAMSLFCGVFDLKQGTLTYLNSSHCKPYLISPDSPEYGSRHRIFLLSKAEVSLLGCKVPGEPIEPDIVSFEPGEILFLYTDGLFDNLAAPTRRAKRMQILEKLSTSGSGQSTPAQILDQLKQGIFDSSATSNLVDDWTMVICQVPWLARFSR